MSFQMCTDSIYIIDELNRTNQYIDTNIYLSHTHQCDGIHLNRAVNGIS